ncbi:MAG: tRNA pseudouridine(38-40) synthase TruA [Treponema sp.]|jgi:tRNA pseudouridine38-40 synthase|nr:tRNA pseudouridine(38-40) synthase TruA [Treponema sp.]
MRTILLTISYDGTNYCGWQRQSAKGNNCKNSALRGNVAVKTIQECIEYALEKIHKTHISLAGSGRTDSGVHAFAQAATFISPIDSIPAKNFVQALNAFLPQDIRIVDSKEVENNFHARFSAKKRTYKYFLDPALHPTAHDKRFSWSLYRMPNLQILNDMANILKGELDFTTFCYAGDKSLSKCRFIEYAEFKTITDCFENTKIVFEICANAFLWNMVRSLVGSMVQYEKNGQDARFFKTALEAKDRKLAGITAPASGLFLYKVQF